MKYPLATGTVSIQAQGLAGIVLLAPEPFRLRAADLTLTAEPGTHVAVVVFRDAEEPGPYCDFCFENWIQFHPEYGTFPIYGSCYGDDGSDVGCTYPDGPLQIYLATDGEVTLTIRFGGTADPQNLTATGQVDGEVSELPVRGCSPVPDCSTGFAYGGYSRQIGLGGRPAFALVTGYLAAGSGSVNPGVHGIEVCAYPAWNDQTSSGAAADHPRGCDADANPAPVVAGEGVLKTSGNQETHGSQYLGFSAWNRRLLRDATFGVWGLWMEAGIECASDDYSDCAL